VCAAPGEGGRGGAGLERAGAAVARKRRRMEVTVERLLIDGVARGRIASDTGRLDTLTLDGTETDVDPEREILDEEVEMYLR